MKRISKIILFTLITTCVAQAQSSDSEFSEVAKVLNYYLIGGTNNDFETLAKAFHISSTMKFVSDDQYREVNVLDFFKKGMKPGPAQERKTSIQSIEVSGNAAQARLKIEYDTFYFHDYMQLLKVAGEWKITSKIFYKENK
ncbi:MAG: nuclear transport factor 2 family protein [Fulvivirga sp.]|uniref:nuclear transport factor 2 family protein n=1 Tax=Fulvivirga sp. TaxID=1931237 RepID=UPI00330384C8